MVHVRVKEDEPFEKALRKFKNKWIKSGILREVKARSFYLKPSASRKLSKRSEKKEEFDSFSIIIWILQKKI